MPPSKKQYTKDENEQDADELDRHLKLVHSSDKSISDLLILSIQTNNEIKDDLNKLNNKIDQIGIDVVNTKETIEQLNSIINKPNEGLTFKIQELSIWKQNEEKKLEKEEKASTEQKQLEQKQNLEIHSLIEWQKGIKKFFWVLIAAIAAGVFDGLYHIFKH